MFINTADERSRDRSGWLGVAPIPPWRISCEADRDAGESRWQTAEATRSRGWSAGHDPRRCRSRSRSPSIPAGCVFPSKQWVDQSTQTGRLSKDQEQPEEDQYAHQRNQEPELLFDQKPEQLGRCTNVVLHSDQETSHMPRYRPFM